MLNTLAIRFRKWRPLPRRPDGRVASTEVRTGAVFARINETQVTETARVLSIEDHWTGIPHVRYLCRLHRSDRIFDDSPRTLALPSFLERFQRAA